MEGSVNLEITVTTWKGFIQAVLQYPQRFVCPVHLKRDSAKGRRSSLRSSWHSPVHTSPRVFTSRVLRVYRYRPSSDLCPIPQVWLPAAGAKIRLGFSLGLEDETCVGCLDLARPDIEVSLCLVWPSPDTPRPQKLELLREGARRANEEKTAYFLFRFSDSVAVNRTCQSHAGISAMLLALPD